MRRGHVLPGHAAFGVAVVALMAISSAGCSSSGDDGATPSVPSSATVVDTTVTASTPTGSTPTGSTHTGSTTELPSYVVVSGDTLSGIADGSGVTLDELIEANAWPESAAHLIVPGDVITLPRHAAIVPRTTAPATGGTSAASPPSGSGGYREVTGDELLGWRGDDGMTDAITEPLADGIYYASQYHVTPDGSAVQFDLARFISTEACIEALDTVPEGTVDQSGCYGGYADTTATDVVRLPHDSAAPVIVVTDDYRYFEISAREFALLLDGERPSADAPEGFRYAPYWDAIVEVANGAVVRANQRPSS